MIKKNIFNSLVVFLTFLFIYAVLDISFRVLGIGGCVYLRPDPLLGTSLIPGACYRQSAEGFSKGKINSHGLRDYEYSYEKPENTFRIVILGDSFTEALQVALDSTFHQILERRLNAGHGGKKHEVIAMGVSGMGTLEEMLWYETEGRKYHPDLVLCAFFIGNDFRDNSRELSTRIVGSTPKPFLLSDGAIDRQFVATKSFRLHASLLPLMRGSRVLTYILRSIEKIRMGKESADSGAEFPPDLYVYNASYDSAWAHAVQTTARILQSFHSEVAKDSAQFILLGIPDSYRIYRETFRIQILSMPDDLDFNKPDSLLASMARSFGFHYISLFPCFKDAFEKTKLFYYGFGDPFAGGHWNERGHELAARCLEEELTRFISIP
jgi:hypothetical protein